MLIFPTALIFFIITNPIGNAPAILSIIKDYDFKSQQRILLREGFFALLVALFFQYYGELFMDAIGARDYTLTLCGGVILFLLALGMMYPNHKASAQGIPKQEPFIVPIATPLMAGPGLMSMIMIKAKLAESNFEISAALLIAFSGVIAVMVVAPYLQRLLGKRGLDALEQVMGMLLCLIGVEMLVNGTRMFIETLKN